MRGVESPRGRNYLKIAPSKYGKVFSVQLNCVALYFFMEIGLLYSTFRYEKSYFSNSASKVNGHVFLFCYIMLKLSFQLPEALMTFDLYPEFIQIAKVCAAIILLVSPTGTDNVTIDLRVCLHL